MSLAPTTDATVVLLDQAEAQRLTAEIAHRDRLVRQRDTLSVEVTALDALIKVMQADETLTTAGAAIAALGKAA